MKEFVICVAPYPSEKQEEKFHGQISVEEEVIRSCEAGASIAHIHVRDENSLQAVNSYLFQRCIPEIKEYCSIIIEGSTGGMP